MFTASNHPNNHQDDSIQQYNNDYDGDVEVLPKPMGLFSHIFDGSNDVLDASIEYDDYQDASNQYDSDEVQVLPQPMGLFGHKSANNQGYYIKVYHYDQ